MTHAHDTLKYATLSNDITVDKSVTENDHGNQMDNVGGSDEVSDGVLTMYVGSPSGSPSLRLR